MSKKPITKEIMIKAGSYERRSSESEDRQVASLETQRRENTGRAERDGLKVPAEYRLQESHSAKTTGTRPVFEQLLKLIEAGKINVLYVWGPHRISRNAIDTARVVDLIDRGLLLEVRTPGQTFRNTPSDKMLLTLLCTMAKMENDTKGENVRDGLKTKAIGGDYPGPAPIGYMNVGETKGKKKLAKDPERFAMVRKMWDLMLSGRYTPPQIHKIAVEQWGLRTRLRGKGGGKKPSRSNVYHLFNNPFYCGEYEWPRGSGSWHKGNHPAMITREEFDRVQFLLGRKGNPRPKTHTFTYRGFMVCGNCGASITAERKFKHLKSGEVRSYIFYHCTHHKEKKCTQGSIEEKELEKQIAGELARYELPPHVKQWCLKELRAMEDDESEEEKAVAESQKKQLAACARKLDGLMDMRANGEIDENEYRIKKAAVIAEKEQLEAAIGPEGEDSDNWLEVAERGLNFAEAARMAFENDDSERSELRKEIISTVGSNHEVLDKTLKLKADILLATIEDVSKEIKSLEATLEPEGIPNDGSTEWENLLAVPNMFLVRTLLPG